MTPGLQARAAGAALQARAAGAALKAIDLAVGYRQRGETRAVLERVNLAIDPGQLVCLLGPNGIGKSTLLRTLVRMQPALWGRVELGGADLRTIPHAELARCLGVVLTERVVVEALTVQRVIEFGRYPHSDWLGRLTAADHDVVARVMGAVGVRHLAGRDFSQLSDGERQRVMIARALAQEPQLLVLDEPTAFLDVTARVHVMGLLRRLTREHALAVILSTHDLELALRTADVVWLVVPGGDVMVGPPDEIAAAGGITQAFGPKVARTILEKEDVMGSISTMRGDTGETSLAGGVRVSKASARVEAYGNVDELISSIGFARSICDDAAMAAFAKQIQLDLFKVASPLATAADSPKPPIVIEPALTDRLTAEVHRLEAIDGMLADWSIPGEHRAAAAFDVARTVCRRAERSLVRLQESGAVVQPAILSYINRLSDLLWLFGRKLEHDAGVNASLREATGKTGSRFSRAW